MTLANRLRALEATVLPAHPIPPNDGWARAFAAFLHLVPADLRDAVAARLTLSRRLRSLEAAALPPARGRGTAVPDDPVVFARGLVAGAFGAADLDPADPRHTGWLVRAVTFLGTLGDEHQAWLRRARELDPRTHPDAVLLPADDEVVRAALDAVMRRG